jgi:pantoate--beta-alanine ligase
MNAGATQVWAPEYSDIYPNQITKISAGLVGEIFEGRERIGHFDGMLTVINRLFEIVKPKFALFGEKDYQQLFIVNKWVKENEIPVRIISVPTARTADGLALSSRNVRLSEAGFQSALAISRSLKAGSRSEMHRILRAEPGLTLDYAEIIDETTFEVAGSATSRPRGIIAGWVERVRLIDNMSMGVNQ